MPPQLANTQPDDIAAILFTSGSTGVPKGVVYRHRHFVAQIAMLRDAFGIEAGGIDLPTFPPFALFDPALGLTSIIPDMDPTCPARANPRKLHAAIERYGVDQLFGSPALMRVLAEHGAALPTVKRATSAGAPVPPGVVAKMLQLLPDDARFWTPYGATECLPVAAIEGRELLSLRERTEAGAGTCVGRPVPPNEVRIIRIGDEAIAEWSEALLVGAGQVGEITVAGPSATDAYWNRDAQTRLAKIREALPDGGERIVHRMGDLGWFDGEGRLWFCGRKSQRVVVDASTTLCTEQVEPVFNAHPDVARSALAGVLRAAGKSASNCRAAAMARCAMRRMRPGSGRCCAWNCGAAWMRRNGRASPANCAISPTAWCIPRRWRASCAIRSHSRSTSATTPRSAREARGMGGEKISSLPWKGEGQGGAGMDEMAAARELRGSMTDAERALWRLLRNLARNSKAADRRQYPIAGYVADFACMEAGLIDRTRWWPACRASRIRRPTDRGSNRLGYRVIYWNNEHYRKHGWRLEALQHLAATSPPPPRGREGKNEDPRDRRWRIFRPGPVPRPGRARA